MQLLGTYTPSLQKWYYQELLNLIEAAIAKGDYSGGYTFDQSSIDSIITDGESFTDLTLPSAGTRAIDEDFNNPVSLLNARYAALAAEVDDFTAKISILIDILNKDTQLLQQLVYSSAF